MTQKYTDTANAGLDGPMGEIPKRLREYYDSLQGEAIPDRLLDLLEKLDQAEQAQQQQVPARTPASEEFK